MARDNHPRERQARALARKKPTRPAFDRILIVTEGAKTEPLYFEDIRKQKRISSAHIEVVHSPLGTQPRQVVDAAVAKFLQSKAFERVYAVFDRDDHQTYADALVRARQLDKTLKNDERKAVRFFAVPTVPCFELWLLLHFQDVLAFNHRTEIVAKLRARIANYAKGATGIYALTEQTFGAAQARAVHLRGQFQPDGGVDPYTDVDRLVATLRKARG
jgi:hypothetical protein